MLLLSLDIKISESSCKVSEERAWPNSINSSFTIDIVVIPSFIEVIVISHEFISFGFVHAEMSVQNFNSNIFSSVFINVEFVCPLWFGTGFLIDTFNSMIFKNILGEFIHDIIFISCITCKMFWNLPLIWIHPSAHVIDSSWEIFMTWYPSFELG